VPAEAAPVGALLLLCAQWLKIRPGPSLPELGRPGFHGDLRANSRRGAMKLEDEQVSCPKWYPFFLSGVGLASLVLYQVFA
jgi:hypothetical protein